MNIDSSEIKDEAAKQLIEHLEAAIAQNNKRAIILTVEALIKLGYSFEELKK